MKKLNILITLLSCAVVGFFSSCGTTEDGEENLSPLLTVTATGLNANNEIIEGTTFTVDVVAAENPTSGKQLDELEIQRPGADTTITINAPSYGTTLTIDAPAAGVSDTYTFVLRDKDGESSTKTLTPTGISGVVSTPFGTEVQGAFFHIGGSLEGAYDLLNETTVATSGMETSKDMKNIDASGNNFTGSFQAGTGNQTLFVRDNSFDYDNGSVEDATSAFNAGNASSTILNPLAGTILIAKLRGGNDYAVIKIENWDPANNECNCGNLGKLTFNYKKSL